MKIIITETQFIKFEDNINKTLNVKSITEQGFGGQAGIVGTGVSNPIDFPCVLIKGIKPFIYYVKKNKTKLCSKLGIQPDFLLKLTKAAIGIMKRESDFGNSFTALGERLLDWFDDTFLDKKLKKDGTLGSVGPAQFRYWTWKNLDMEKRFGMGREEMRTVTGAGLGTIVSLLGNYKKAISMGYSRNTRSVNPFLEKKGIRFKSTGIAALDLAIVSHNMEIIDKWCYTSNSNLAGPCKSPTYEPYKKGTSDYKKYGTLKVYQNKPILNYFPNKKYGNQTAIGYLEEVVSYMNSLKCVVI